ncbi:MAG: ATP-binding protein [Myxococcota bacterium]|nr:ATP-binding protein [Myxococcota bacterium]
MSIGTTLDAKVGFVNRTTPEIVTRLEWLMFFRVVLITLLLGSTLIFRLTAQDVLSTSKRLGLLGLIVGTYALTIVYAILLRSLQEHFERFAYVQITGDLIISAMLVSLTGGTDSLFLVLFSLSVLAGSIILGRRGSLYAMLIATILIVLLVLRESLGWGVPAGPVGDQKLLAVFLSGLTNVTAVFLVALLAGYLSEQARAAGQRLIDASRDIEALKVLNGHIITSIQSGLVSFTLDQRIIFFNPAAGRITGYEPESVLYARAHELFPGLEQRCDSELLEQWEGEFRRVDGRHCALSYNLSPLRDGQNRHQGWILIIQDLTRLREMEESVQRSERFAAIGKMAAGIAHEIRNPLASMSGSIQILSKAGNLAGTNHRLMQIVLRETDRLNTLVSEFLQFARPNPPAIERVNLKPILDELVLVFQYLQGHEEQSVRDVDITLELEMEDDVKIDADPRQLRQVFWNLLNNAVQAMPEGGLIRLEVERRRREIEVRIEDQGVGIPVDLLDRIFDPFYSTKKRGTGLGLALVHRIVEEHSGRIHVFSQPGEGTRFSVILPKVLAAKQLSYEESQS